MVQGHCTPLTHNHSLCEVWVRYRPNGKEYMVQKKRFKRSCVWPWLLTQKLCSRSLHALYPKAICGWNNWAKLVKGGKNLWSWKGFFTNFKIFYNELNLWPIILVIPMRTNWLILVWLWFGFFFSSCVNTIRICTK